MYSTVCTLNNDDNISFSNSTNLGFYININIKYYNIVFNGVDTILFIGVTGVEGYYNVQKTKTTLTTTNVISIAQHYTGTGSIVKIRTNGPVDKNDNIVL